MKVEDLYVMRYLVGTSDPKLREKFLKESDPTLEGLNKVARNYEVSRASLKAMGIGTNAVSSTAAFTGARPKTQTKSSSTQKVVKKTGGDTGFQSAKLDGLRAKGLCFRCGRPRDHDGGVCIALDKECTKCLRMGHLAKVCFAGKGAQSNTVTTVAAVSSKSATKKTKSSKKTTDSDSDTA